MGIKVPPSILAKTKEEAIEAARKRMDKGHYYTEEEAKKILGLAQMYDIIFDKKALEFLNKLDYKIKERIFIKIISTKEKPFRYFQKLTYRE